MHVTTVSVEGQTTRADFGVGVWWIWGWRGDILRFRGLPSCCVMLLRQDVSQPEEQRSRVDLGMGWGWGWGYAWGGWMGLEFKI